MLERIYSEEKLQHCLSYLIEEEGVRVDVGHSLLLNDDLNSEQIAILKPDAYYNTRDFASPPKAADNLVVVNCDQDYDIYIIELKSTSRARRIKSKEIEEKFKGVLESFFSEFDGIFHADFPLRNFCLWVVCDPLSLRGRALSDVEFRRKIAGTAIDFVQSIKPMRYKGKLGIVQAMLPPPTIELTGYSPAV